MLLPISNHCWRAVLDGESRVQIGLEYVQAEQAREQKNWRGSNLPAVVIEARPRARAYDANSGRTPRWPSYEACRPSPDRRARVVRAAPRASNKEARHDSRIRGKCDRPTPATRPRDTPVRQPLH